MPIPGSVLGNVLPFGVTAVLGIYPSLGTLQVLTIAEDSTGQEVHTFADSTVSGQHDLPCRLGPLILIRPQNQEARSTEMMQREVAGFQVNFASYLNVDLKTLLTWRVKVDGVVYEIMGVDNDGSHITTRLNVAVINPVSP